MSEFLSICGIFGILGVIVGAVLIIISSLIQNHYEEAAIHLLFAGVACILCAMSGLSLVRTKQAEIMIDNGAKVFIDGQEVNTDIIDLDNYNLEKIKNNCIFLSE